MKIRYATMESPVGPVAVAWSGDAVVSLHMQAAATRDSYDTKYTGPGPVKRLEADLRKRFGDVELEEAARGKPLTALRRYFDGDVAALDTLAVDPGGRGFQGRVWKQLRRIRAGRTLTYGEIAKACGSPGAARAAGRAVGSNPIAIIIPCHRVVGHDRKLTGFGGGLKRKKWLLEHEGALPRDLL